MKQVNELGTISSYLLTLINQYVGNKDGNSIVSKENEDFAWDLYCLSCRIYTEEDAFNQLQ
jgi:hypothetical protein